MRYITSLKTACCGIILTINMAYAQAFQPHASIYSAMTDFVYQQLQDKVTGRLEVTPQHLDSHLKLNQCQQALSVFIPSQTTLLRSSTLGVRCDSLPRWTVYVPIKIKVLAKVLVSKRSLARHQSLQASDVHLAEVDISRVRSEYYTKATHLVGQIMNRHLRPGEIIKKNDLSAPILIGKGNTVMIHVSHGNLKVSMKGVALENAKQGELVSVRNLKSGKIVHAVAKTSHSVEVPL